MPPPLILLQSNVGFHIAYHYFTHISCISCPIVQFLLPIVCAFSLSFQCYYSSLLIPCLSEVGFWMHLGFSLPLCDYSVVPATLITALWFATFSNSYSISRINVGAICIFKHSGVDNCPVVWPTNSKFLGTL